MKATTVKRNHIRAIILHKPLESIVRMINQICYGKLRNKDNTN